MSISNNYFEINDIIKKYSKNILKRTKKWTIIYIDKNIFDNENDYQYSLFIHSIQTIKTNININQIYIYTNDLKKYKPIMNNFCIKMNIKLIDMPKIKTAQLLIIQKAIMNNENIILINTENIFIVNNNSLAFILDKNPNIYSYFKEIDNDENNIYKSIGNKLNIDKFINASLLIIPYSEINFKYIDLALQYGNQLETSNQELVTNISLTISNTKFNFIVQNIKYTNIAENITWNLNMYNQLYNKMTFFDKNSNISILDFYLEQNYLYYPGMNFNDKYIKKIHTVIKNNNSNEKSNEDMPILLNTCGYSLNLNNFNSINFNFICSNDEDIKCGILLKKSISKPIIPKILHHIWDEKINDDVKKKYNDIWSKTLKDPWKYKLWTIEDIELYISMETNKWYNLYKSEESKTIKFLIICLAVLEKYGGIVIHNSVVPLKQIPNDLLENSFMLSFSNKNDGNKLSYDVVASISEEPIIQSIYKIIYSNDLDKLKQIENLLMIYPKTMIYPDYYFAPIVQLLPKSLFEKSIFARSEKINIFKIKNKNILKRKHIITPQAIISKLNEDPKNKLKNINKNRIAFS